VCGSILYGRTGWCTNDFDADGYDAFEVFRTFLS
jgi:hypothetical protein